MQRLRETAERYGDTELDGEILEHWLVDEAHRNAFIRQLDSETSQSTSHWKQLELSLNQELSRLRSAAKEWKNSELGTLLGDWPSRDNQSH